MINLQLPVVILKKSSISDMQHRKRTTISTFSKIESVDRSVKTVHTNVFAKIISCIDECDPVTVLVSVNLTLLLRKSCSVTSVHMTVFEIVVHRNVDN